MYIHISNVLSTFSTPKRLIHATEAQIIVAREVHAPLLPLRELQVVQGAEEVTARTLPQHHLHGGVRRRADRPGEAVHIELVPSSKNSFRGSTARLQGVSAACPSDLLRAQHVLKVEIRPTHAPLLAMHLRAPKKKKTFKSQS